MTRIWVYTHSRHSRFQKSRALLVIVRTLFPQRACSCWIDLMETVWTPPTERRFNRGRRSREESADNDEKCSIIDNLVFFHAPSPSALVAADLDWAVADRAATRPRARCDSLGWQREQHSDLCALPLLSGIHRYHRSPWRQPKRRSGQKLRGLCPQSRSDCGTATADHSATWLHPSAAIPA